MLFGFRGGVNAHRLRSGGGGEGGHLGIVDINVKGDATVYAGIRQGRLQISFHVIGTGEVDIVDLGGERSNGAGTALKRNRKLGFFGIQRKRRGYLALRGLLPLDNGCKIDKIRKLFVFL